MEHSRLATETVRNFQCLGATCPDTCCRGWGMQLTSETIALYREHAPELLESVTSGESEFIMKRDGHGACVKLDGGLCAIQRDKGTGYLGDACHFYPRVTRSMGELMLTGAVLSCPEAARLMLYGGDPYTYTMHEVARVPYQVRDYLPEGLDARAALAIHQQFMEIAGDESVGASQALMRVSTIARALERLPVGAWMDAIALYRPMADGRIPPAEPEPYDMVRLVSALHGLMAAGNVTHVGLNLLLQQLLRALKLTVNPAGSLVLAEDTQALAIKLLAQQRRQAPYLQPVLRRYLQAQLSQSLFPFAGLGATFSERITIIGVRFAITRLALAVLSDTPSEAEVIGVVQPIARFLDHLSDPTFSLQIFAETGWIRESRLKAII